MESSILTSVKHVEEVSETRKDGDETEYCMPWQVLANEYNPSSSTLTEKMEEASLGMCESTNIANLLESNRLW